MAIVSMDLGTAFLLGLVGSLHCAGMCGPLALALPAAGNSTPGYVLGRVAYNAGRIATYCLLGIVFGLAGWTFLLAGVQRWTSIALGVALLLGLFASRKLGLSRPVTFAVNQLKSRMSVLLRRRTFAALAVLGLLNGLLPCGLVGRRCHGRHLGRRIVYDCFRYGHRADDAGDQSLREAGSDSAALEAGKGNPSQRLPARHAADSARHVPGHSVRQPRHVRQRRVLLPQIAPRREF